MGAILRGEGHALSPCPDLLVRAEGSYFVASHKLLDLITALSSSLSARSRASVSLSQIFVSLSYFYRSLDSNTA